MAITKQSNLVYRKYNGTDGWDICYFQTTAGSVIESTTRKFLTPQMTINGLALFNGAITLDTSNIKVSSTFGTTNTKFNDKNIEEVFTSLLSQDNAFVNELDIINDKISGELLKKADITSTINDNDQREDKVPSAAAVNKRIVLYYDDVIKPEIESLINPSMEFKGVWSTTTALPSGAKKGDTYKLGANMGGMHKGDLLIAVKDNPSTTLSTIDDGINWSIIHGEADTNTADTWRAIKVNGVQKLSNSIGQGPVNFKDGTNTKVAFYAGDSGIKINVDFSGYVVKTDYNTNNTNINNQLTSIGTRVTNIENRAANKVFVGAQAPTSGMIAGDIWIDTSNAVAVA